MGKYTSLGRRAALLLIIVITVAVGGLAVAKSAAPIEQLIERAYFFAAHGLSELAASQLQDVVKADAKNTEARLVAGMALQANGKEEQAIALWREADHLGDPAAPAFIGDALYMRGDLDGAEVAYKRALERQKGAARPTIGLALIAESRGQYETAVNLLKPIAIPNKESTQAPVIDAMYYLGRIYFKAEQVDESIAVLKQGVLFSPDHAGMYLVLAQAYEKKRSIPEAKHAYERALQLAPDMTTAIEGLQRLTK